MVVSGLIFLSLFLVTGCTVNDAVPFLDKLTSSVGGWMGFSGIIAGVLEVLVRVFPSINPTSFLLLVASVGHSVANLCTALSGFLDSLGLQNAKSLKSEIKV